MEPITHETPGRVELNLRIGVGEIEIGATDGDRTIVEIDGERRPEDFRVVMNDLPGGGHRITIAQRGSVGGWGRRGSVRVRVTTREGADLRTETGSADLVVSPRLASLVHRSGSGDIALGDVDGDVVLKVASGDVRGGAIGGDAAVDTASGDVELASVGGDLTARLASGDLRVRAVAGSAKVSSASGDISVGAVALGSASLTSMSGDISVGVRPGTRVWLDLSSVSGSATSELDPSDAPAEGPALELRASSVSGDVRVTRAPAA